MKQVKANNVLNAQVVCSSRLPLRQMLLPLGIVFLGFATMGFVGGTMEVLNKHFQDVLGLNKLKAAGIQASFFGAYIIGPLTTSGWLVRKYGYKISLIVGYSLLATGCIFFWPSGHFASFGGFCGSIFLIGSGFALLDCASIPYTSSLGPTKSSEIRVNIAFAIQSTFSVIALTVSSYLILGPVQADPHVTTSTALLPVQQVYLGVGCSGFLLALLTFFAPIPEINDAVLNTHLELTQANSGWRDKPLSRQLTLWLAFFASFTFVGSQGALAAFFINFAQAAKPSLSAPSAARHLAIAQAVFAASRFGSTLLMRYIKPRYILLSAMILTITFLAGAMGTSGNTALVLLTLEFASKSCVHPTIVSLALRGLGRHTKRGGAILVSALASGMLFTPAMGAVAEKLGSRWAVCVPLAGVIVAISFAVYVNFWRGRLIDALGASSLAVLPPLSRREIGEEGSVNGGDGDPSGQSQGDGENDKYRSDGSDFVCCDGDKTCEEGCETRIEDVCEQGSVGLE